MDLDYVKIIITIVLAVIGWLIGHYFTSQRDISNKRRELVINHLIETYRILANDISHREQSGETNLKLENLLSDIQLFGNNSQIELAKQLADEIAGGGSFELNNLLVELRDNLRKELNLSPVIGNVKWLRFNGPKA